MHRSILSTGLLAAMCLHAAARADINFTITFDDPNHVLSPYAGPLTANLMAAAHDWASRMTGDTTLTIAVRAGSDFTASGRSGTSSYVETVGGIDIFEQGAAAKVRTGFDANGDDPDIEISIGRDYLVQQLWFDPDPAARTAPVPQNRIDAYSVLLHELGHAFVYNGWMDGQTGALPGDYESTFDRLVGMSGGNFFYHGAAGVTAYGSTPAITFGNPFHWGNNPPRPGSNLIPQLMNGVVFYYGQRYFISDLDIAVLRDLNLPAPCVADVDDGSGAGHSDGGVTIDDLLYYLSLFSDGLPAADVDDGSGTGTRDGGVTIDDLLYFLTRFAAGC